MTRPRRKIDRHVQARSGSGPAMAPRGARATSSRLRTPHKVTACLAAISLLVVLISILSVGGEPSVTLSLAPGQPAETKSVPIHVVASFSEEVSGFAAGDVFISGTASPGTPTVSPSGNGDTFTIEIPSATSDGTIVVSIPAGACASVQSPSYTNTLSNTVEVLLDRTAPTEPGNRSPGTPFITDEDEVTFSWDVSSDGSGSGVQSYKLFLIGATIRNEDDATSPHTFSLLNEGTHQWCVAARDNVGNLSGCDFWSFIVDWSPPKNPAVSSSTHQQDAWSDSASVQIDISGASDEYTAVDGYEVAWTKSTSWAGSGSPNRSPSWSGETFTATSDGDWYLYIHTVDEAGHWSDPDRHGPFKIDTTAPANPIVVSTSHVPGVWSNNSSVMFSATGASDALSGVDGFAVDWSTSAAPPGAFSQTDDASWVGEICAATSDGTWYLHVFTTDAVGNWSNAVTVGPFRIDTTLPVLTVPADIETVSDPGSSTAVVNYSPTANDNLDSTPVVISAPLSGSAFPIGTTVVAVTATDHAGNETTDTFEVHVRDAEAPVLHGVPEGLHAVTAPGKTTVPVSWDPITATDNDDPSPAVILSHFSGQSFPVGVTHVRITARDRNGKEATATFDVTVEYTPPLFDFTVVPEGESGFLDRALPEEDGVVLIGNLELAAIYEIGELISGACSLVRPSGEALTGSYVIIGFYRVDVSLDPEKGLLLATWNATFDHETDCFRFEFDTTEITPGIHDLRLGFQDGTVIWIRVELIDPPEEAPVD